MTWAYLFIGFLEAPHSRADTFYSDPGSNITLSTTLEVVILVFYFSEILMEIYHKSHDSTKGFKQKYLKNKKILCKIAVDILFLSDFIIAKASYPAATFRFSKLIRPCKLTLIPNLYENINIWSS